MGQKKNKTKLKLTLGSFRFEYEGREDFLMAEVPHLVESIDKLQATRFKMPFDVLHTAIKDALVTQEGAEAAIERMKNDIDSLSDLSEMESLRLQQAMDQMSKMMSTLSNLLKKASDTAAGITQNLK